jgi:hypothetical protein
MVWCNAKDIYMWVFGWVKDNRRKSIILFYSRLLNARLQSIDFLRYKNNKLILYSYILIDVIRIP